jgi:hypothetical protein
MVDKLEEYLIIPAEHVEKILAEWLSKHFGHILSGRLDTAEYARVNMAHNDLKATLMASVSPAIVAIQEPVQLSLPIEAPVADVVAPVAPVVEPVIEPVAPVEAPQEPEVVAPDTSVTAS